MMNLIQTNSLISDVERELIPQSVECTFVHNEKLNTLFWYKNCGELRTEKEVKNKIQRYEEECLLLDTKDLNYKGKKEGIKLLKEVLK